MRWVKICILPLIIAMNLGPQAWATPQQSFRFIHFNIKELTTHKLLDPTNAQVLSAVNTLKKLDGDILSINEMQYDKSDVPTTGLPGTGENIFRLLERINAEPLDLWNVHFFEARTGMKARRKADGSYYADFKEPEARSYADAEHFGIFPGQYSTALALKFPITSRTVYANPLLGGTRDVLWKEFNPSIDLTKYRLTNSEKIPEDTSLFDKNFNDTVVEIAGKRIHIITFHTVPAFNFGNPRGANLARNADQLGFLEWYLLGTCSKTSANIIKSCQTDIKPLPPGSSFIVVGDLNVDISTSKPGATVLQRIYNHNRVQKGVFPTHTDKSFRIHEGQNTSTVTYLSEGIDLGKLQQQLDYFIVSSDITILETKIYSPMSEFKNHGCYKTRKLASNELTNLRNSLVSSKVATVSRRRGTQQPYCLISVTKTFAAFRNASDHFPMYLDFRI